MPNVVTRSAAWRFFYVQIWRRVKFVWLLFRAWLFNVFVGIDTLINGALFFGDAGETLSSRLGKGKQKKQPVHTFFSRIVDAFWKALFGQKNHCVKSIQYDEGKHAISRVIDRYRAGEKQIWRL